MWRPSATHPSARTAHNATRLRAAAAGLRIIVAWCSRARRRAAPPVPTSTPRLSYCNLCSRLPGVLDTTPYTFAEYLPADPSPGSGPNCSLAAFDPPILSSRLSSQVCTANKVRLPRGPLARHSLATCAGPERMFACICPHAAADQPCDPRATTASAHRQDPCAVHGGDAEPAAGCAERDCQHQHHRRSHELGHSQLEV